MESLLYFLFWAVMIFVMMRMGCGRTVMGQDNGTPDIEPSNDQLFWQPPKKDLDPVCGKSVHTMDSLSSVFAGSVFYFCSSPCREAFEAAPDIYLSEDPRFNLHKLEKSHG